MEKLTKIIEAVSNKINFVEFHKDLVFNGTGMKILVWEDGETSIIDQNSRPANPDEKYISFPCWGIGNVNTAVYSEGWCTQDDCGNYINTETGEIITVEAMIKECIEDGDFSEYYEAWKEDIERKFIEDYL